LLSAGSKDSNLRQVRVSRSETTEPLAGDGPEGEAKPSHPARPTSVKKRPKGAFLLSTDSKDSNLRQVRVERSETTEPLAGDGPEGEAKPSHPARPTSVKKRPKGAFLLSAGSKRFTKLSGTILYNAQRWPAGRVSGRDE